MTSIFAKKDRSVTKYDTSVIVDNIVEMGDFSKKWNLITHGCLASKTFENRNNTNLVNKIM